jgi:hypothetical protein
MTEPVKASAGETVRIPVYLDGCKEILGYQFTASLDPSMFTLEGVQAANMPVGDENIGVFEDKPGVFTMSWHSIQPVTLTADEPAFYLIVTAKEDVRVHQWIDINNHITEAMAFDKSYRIMKTNFRTLGNQNENESSLFAVRQNVPNPFADQTMISFTIPTNEMVQLKIMDVSGRLMYTTEMYYEAGTHQIKLDKNTIGRSGILYYQISAGENTATRKMVLIE